MNNINKAYSHKELVPDAYWKQFTADYLAPSKNLWITDIDSVIRSREGCIILVELKRQRKQPDTSQSVTYSILEEALKAIDGKPIKVKEFEYPITTKFMGTAVISFENTTFEDGKVYLNGKESSKEEIIEFLSFGDQCKSCFPAKCLNCCPPDDKAAA